MARATIRGGTFSKVPMKVGSDREVQFPVYGDGSRHYREICEPHGAPIDSPGTPEGMTVDRSSYEVLHRYVPVDAVAA